MASGNMSIDLGITHSDFRAPAGDVVIDLTSEDLVIDLRAVEAEAEAERSLSTALAPTPAVEPENLEVGLLAATKGELLAKRVLDVATSIVVLLLVLPVLLLTALAVACTSRGPVFYVQERVGRGGMPFRMLKFRSMFVDAHERRAALELLNEASGPVFKVRKDPRVTPVGRVIRKLSIDELPQLVNVLRGEMSLVGPRPPLPDEYATYDHRAMRRLLVTPGLTCIWQVSGRSNIEFDQWVEMDVDYIRSWSLGLDVRLLVKTVPAVLSGNGAY